jgi:hypothetical protein
MAKIRFTTNIDEEILRQMKIEGINNRMSVAEIIEKCWSQQNVKKEQQSKIATN